jgi:hypothetical protein
LEKDVLEFALHSDTEEEVAGALDISIWTVKKRWQRIYEKVEGLIPTFFSTAESGNNGDEKSSSGQRRRHLLDYLRQHPEEIRPNVESSGSVPLNP